MGICVFCGKSAGWFRDRHDECAAAAAAAEAAARKPYEDLKSAVVAWVRGEIDMIGYLHAFQAIPGYSDMNEESKRSFVIGGFNQGLESFLEDKRIGPPTLERMEDVMTVLQIKWEDPDVDGALTTAWRKDLTRYHVERKEYAETAKSKDNLSVRFRRGEKLLWGFNGVDLREEVVKRRHVGTSGGVRVGVGKRSSVRLGRSEGHWEETVAHPVVDTGVLCITDRRVVFAGSSHSLHIDIEEIESLSHGNRSMTIMRDTDDYEPSMFSDFDAVFAHRLVASLIKNVES